MADMEMKEWIVKDTLNNKYVQELVRCKDCKQVTMYETANGQTICECGLTESFHKPDWFCADGERKDD